MSTAPTIDQLARAREMREQGATLPEIAAAFGRRRFTIALWLKKRPARPVRAKAPPERGPYQKFSGSKIYSLPMTTPATWQLRLADIRLKSGK
jgi:transposase